MITSGMRPLPRANPCYVVNLVVNLVMLVATAAR
jgi:hypothetical protein